MSNGGSQPRGSIPTKRWSGIGGIPASPTPTQVAADILVSKYLRKAGVPQRDADGELILDDDGNPVLGSETSARQVIDRLASTWRWWC